eukprot:399663-Rhodomonas_salina.2
MCLIDCPYTLLASWKVRTSFKLPSFCTFSQLACPLTLAVATFTIGSVEVVPQGHTWLFSQMSTGSCLHVSCISFMVSSHPP